jgi:hypothetical protein
MILRYSGRFYKVIKVKAAETTPTPLSAKTNIVAGYPENLGKELRKQRKLKTILLIGNFEV